MFKLSGHSARRAILLLSAILAGPAWAHADSPALPPDSASRTVLITSGWEFRQSDPVAGVPATSWLPAVVPGDVHLDLLRNRLIPAPFYRDDEAKLQWIQNAGWEYRATVVADAALLRHRNIDLVFEGLDTVATVYLNGHPLLHSDNMFRAWRADAKPFLRLGANQLLVTFPSAVSAAEAAAASDPWRAQTQTKARTYVRKAAYEYGWDWGPTFITSGIWRPVELQAWNDARISNLYIHQLDVSSTVAHLDAAVEVTASVHCAARIEVSMQTPSGNTVRFSQNTTLDPGVNHIDLPIEVDHPALWYPAGYGAHPLYAFQASVSSGGRLQDEATAHAGLRSVVLRRVQDQWGRSFEFVVNGIPIFAKGADVIPFDSFPNRVTDAQIRGILQSAVDANMNMVRVWGGGYYETDQFYTICDQLGLMVWQDFMFGNEWQPGTYAFRQNVQKEVEYQVKRLRNHPSIVLWCGNNETEISWDWDQMKAITRDLSSETRRRMWQDYLLLFSGVIPQTVERLNPETPYWPSSPSADYEHESPSYQSGDMHDWAVWHGGAPFSEYDSVYPRFMSEYGFQSFPEMRTIDAFTLPQDRASIFTPVMLAHQKNDEGNAIIRDYMLHYYGQPKNFADFLYASQVLQAEGVKVGAEHLRRSMPRSMGSLYWQLNDCWPVASWSSIDYYGRWKALQYYARRFYSPLLVSPTVQNGTLSVYVVSDKLAPVHGALSLRLMTMRGDVVRQVTRQIDISPLASKVYITLPIEDILRVSPDLSHIFAAASLTVNGAVASSNILYLVPTPQIHLLPAVIARALTPAPSGYDLTLTSPVLARSVYVDFGDQNVHLSDNFFDLLPNQPVTISISSKAGLQQLQKALTIMSLSDAFSTGPTNSPLGIAPANPNWK